MSFPKEEYDQLKHGLYEPIPDYVGLYVCTKRGIIVSLSHAKPMVLHGSYDRNGYRRVQLYKNGKIKYIKVASLVLLTFVGEKPHDCVVCHNNGDEKDDRLLNLRYDSHRNNIKDKEYHNTKIYGELHQRAKITEKEAMEIYNSKLKIVELVDKYQLSRSSIYDIRRKITWKHIHN